MARNKNRRSYGRANMANDDENISAKKTLLRADEISDASEDEFMKQRHKISLVGSDAGGSDSEVSQTEALGFDSDIAAEEEEEDDEHDDDMTEVDENEIAAGMRTGFYDSDSEVEAREGANADGGEEGDEGVWGSKRDYYNADLDDEEQEEQEALRLQRQQALHLEEDAFADLWEQSVEAKAAREDMEDDTGDLQSKKSLAKAEFAQMDNLCETMKVQLREVETILDPIVARYAGQTFASEDEGLRFLKVKNEIFLSYQINALFLMYLKSSGKPFADHPVLKRLIHYRVLLDKIRPIEQKLQHKIERLTRAQQSLDPEEQKNLAFKPSLGDLVLDKAHNDGGDVSEADEDEAGQPLNDKYRPPKVNPVHYDDDPKSQKKQRDAEREQARQARRSKMQAMLNDEDEQPLVIEDFGNNIKGLKSDKKLAERERFEEENFIRMMETREDKKRRNEASKFNDELKELADDFSGLQSINTSSKRRRGGDDEDDDAMDDDDMSDDFKGKAGAMDEILSENDSDDDYYEDTARAQRNKKAKHKEDMRSKYEPNFDEFEVDEFDNTVKRQIDRSIEKNKGLTEFNSRKKENRNPRVKHRRKFERGLKRLQSFKASAKPASSAYGGEKTGIKKNVSKSVKF